MEPLQLLLQQQDLTFSQAHSLFSSIMRGQLSDIELTAALMALKFKGENAAEIAGAAQAMRDNANGFDKKQLRVADSCGTGGDGTNTINVSTTAAIVASACGINMVKHGNRSVSSKSGSADLLKALGINIDMTPKQAEQCLAATGFTFLFAPHYHSGVKHAMPVRTELKTRTIFNILGPLANPAQPQVQLLGVYDPALVLPMAQTLQQLGTERAMVVHGSGTDEIALHGETLVAEVNHGEVKQYTLNPSDFALENYSLAAIAGDTPQYNAEASLAILNGEGTAAHNAAIVANVAALLVLSDKTSDFKQASEMVQEVLRTKQAMATLANIVEVSNG